MIEGALHVVSDAVVSFGYPLQLCSTSLAPKEQVSAIDESAEHVMATNEPVMSDDALNWVPEPGDVAVDAMAAS